MNPAPHLNVLLVEDNLADVRLIQEASAEEAWLATLHWVSTGEAALDFVRRQGAYQAAPAPDLVLLDLNLPGLDGHEVIEVLKSEPGTLHIPVVVLSSSTAESDVMRAYQRHANAYVKKPGDFANCLDLVKSLRAWWAEAVSLPGHVAPPTAGPCPPPYPLA